MENEPMAAHEEAPKAKVGRLMGKLFGRKAVAEETTGNPPDNLSDFFRGSIDTLEVSHPAPPAPPLLAKLDISRATRYPNALDVAAYPQQGHALGPRLYSPPKIRRNKGLVVRFVDAFPEIIGNGGDECDIPTVEISKRKPIRPPAVTTKTAPPRPSAELYKAQIAFPGAPNQDNFIPPPLRRAQTGHTSIPGSRGPAWPVVPASENTSSEYLDKHVVPHDDRRRSFIEAHQAEMREAEGLAFVKAHQGESATTGQPTEGRKQTPPAQLIPQPPSSIMGQFIESPEQIISPIVPVQTTGAHKPYHIPQRARPSQPSSASEASPTSKVSYPVGRLDTQLSQGPLLDRSPSSEYSAGASRQPSTRQGSKLSDLNDRTSPPRDAIQLAEGDALDTFVLRTRHLFALFRLHAEMSQPLTSYTPTDLARAALWWFLRGRMALEVTVRERPSSPQGQEKNEFAKQQAYADLAKGYWLSQDVIPDIRESKGLQADHDVDEARRALRTSLQKLALSMQRNGFLPPEEAFLPQTIDKFIWVEYPPLSQDIVSILWGAASSALTQMQTQESGMSILDTLPLGDSAHSFCFGRVQVEAMLMEQGGYESQRLYLPCLLSVVRPQKQSDLVFVIASQNGAVQLRIQSNKNAGPSWDDVRWRSDAYCVDIRLPRGFILVIQCSPSDFRMLWNMHDFSAKVQSYLYPRQGEQCVFRSTLKAFQYFDNDPQARQFPKEPTPNCEIGLFERVLREGAATGPRSFHRGYRAAVVTGNTTKTVSGVNQIYLPQQPLQYGFLRGDHNDPALSLKFENGRQKGSMVMTFNEDKERLRLHSLLAGTILRGGEHAFCDVPIRGVWFAKYFGDVQSFQPLSSLSWERVRVINDGGGGSDRPQCVLSDKLRVIFECKDGTMTDRVNVAPGELKLRLDVANPTCLMLYRQPQADFTITVTEAKVPRELAQGLSMDLDTLQQCATLRTYMFPTLAELHQFQEALTGFKVVFDGFASTFAISRRRMVVPIHKKWEAGATRIQVIQQDRVTQLLAFFDEFSHGKCMSFTLKGTDQYEAAGKGSKAGVKFIDAKFPLPKMLPDGQDGSTIQATADTAFVCLDLPELPGEHDDISITFENEADRDRLIQCLPAPVKTSKLTLKK